MVLSLLVRWRRHDDPVCNRDHSYSDQRVTTVGRFRAGAAELTTPALRAELLAWLGDTPHLGTVLAAEVHDVVGSQHHRDLVASTGGTRGGNKTVAPALKADVGT